MVTARNYAILMLGIIRLEGEYTGTGLSMNTSPRFGKYFSRISSICENSKRNLSFESLSRFKVLFVVLQ